MNGQYKIAIEQYSEALQHINLNTNNDHHHDNNSLIIDLLTKRAEVALHHEAYDEALQDATAAIIINNQFVKGWAFRILALKGIEKKLTNSNYYHQHRDHY